MKKINSKLISLVLVMAILLTGCDQISADGDLLQIRLEQNENLQNIDKEELIQKEGDEQPYIVVNNNVPYFEESDYTTKAFEEYSDLDSLGRCGVAYANICKEIMPTKERGSISSIKPSGWQTKKYDIVDGKYLYNRCHLIGYQLSGENANKKNLITGTRYMNVEGMLPFENMVADYVKETNNHVLYRVTPIFDGDNLVASGVLIEAKSVEDDGEGIELCVYCYNIQPGIEIDYATGDSLEVGTKTSDTTKNTVWITESGTKYHSKNTCGKMNADNAKEVTKEEAIELGKEKCSKCW